MLMFVTLPPVVATVFLVNNFIVLHCVSPVPAKLLSPRLCVIASTNAVGGAVRRNRAKRRLREVFRHQQAHVPAGCDLVLVARGSATGWPMADLEKRFTAGCAEIGRDRAAQP